MYKKIKKQKTTLTLYTERLIKDGLIPEGEIEDMKAAFQAHLNEEFEDGKDYKPNKADWLDGKWSHLDRNKEDYQRGDTAIDETTFKIGKALTTAPENFPLHKTVSRLLEAKAKMFETGEGFDWATGEALGIRLTPDRRLPCALVRPRLYTRHIQPPPFGSDQPRQRRPLLPAEPHPRRASEVRSHRLDACRNTRFWALNTATHLPNQMR